MPPAAISAGGIRLSCGYFYFFIPPELVLPLMPLLLEPLMPLPVVPLPASGYFFISAWHCESFCIEVCDMPWHFVQVVFSLLVMLEAGAARVAPAKAVAMPMPRAIVANFLISNSSVSR
jgi:hypothetical protein